MKSEETKNILEGFPEIAESFKTELQRIGVSSSRLLGFKEINSDFELFQTVAFIIVDVFKIYDLADNLESFLSAESTVDKYTDFEFLKFNIHAIINGIKSFNNSNVADKFKNKNHAFYNCKERLTQSIEHLTYFLNEFIKIYEYYEVNLSESGSIKKGVVYNG